MRYYNNYEFTYQDLRSKNKTSFTPSESLVTFFKGVVEKRFFLENDEQIDVLEIGPGMGSIFANCASDQFTVDSIDISPTAIEVAKEQNKVSNISFSVGDICNFSSSKSYDLAFDGHCLHCLTDDEDRKRYFINVFNSLKYGGFFALETMTSHGRMDFDEGYQFCQDDNILYKKTSDDKYYDYKILNGERYIPFRKIIHALDIEKEILNVGFKIIYLRIYENYKMIPDSQRTYSCMTDPDMFRSVAIKLPPFKK